MRSLLSRGLWLVLFLIPALVGLLHGAQGTKKPDDPIPGLIRQLGSETFLVREDAGKKLVALGEKAIPALRKAAAAHDDVEVRRRAQQLVQTILPAARKSKAIGLELVLIEAGELQMGSLVGERNRRPDESQHGVRITESFYLGAYEVTQDQYEKVMDVNPSWFGPKSRGQGKLNFMDTSRFPVENATWFDALEFCNKLSKRDDLTPYYKLDDVKREDGAIRSARVTIVGGPGYRLPTEAEWEFACRAHTAGAYHFGKQPSTGREGNFKSTFVAGGYGAGPLWKALDQTTTVGSYPGNANGLFDMHGNVAEWCWDYYDKDYYANSPRIDPHGPNAGVHRVNRGGSWLVTEGSCRSASRFMQLANERTYSVGFRVARNP